ENHAKGLQKFLHEKSQLIAENVSLLELKDIPTKIQQILTILNDLKGKKIISDDQYFDLKKLFKNKFFNFYENIKGDGFEAELLKGENEKYLTELFGKEGLFNQLALDKNNSLGDDYFVSLEFHFNVFNLNFNWYLENYTKIPEPKRKKCEFMLLAQACKAEVDPAKLMKTNAILKAFQEKDQNVIQNASKKMNVISTAFAKNRISTMQEFDYRRLNTLKGIPTNFRFATYSLPHLVGRHRTEANASVNTWPLTNHLPEEFSQPHVSTVPTFSQTFTDTERPNYLNDYPFSQQIREVMTT
ncbi:MAG: hypothetical protein ACRDFB_09600, partial [Rhabdochlamydiaceae bacterium]